MRFILLPFIVFPIIEMIVLIEVGSRIGALYTIGLVLLTAVIGAALLRQQGLATLLRANARLQGGELPAREVCEGFIIAVGGALLLTPGFVTDAIGLFCLLPGSRQWLVGRMLKRVAVSGQAAFFGSGFGQGRGAMGSVHTGAGRNRTGQRGEGVVIEGEFDQERDARRPSDAHPDHQLDDPSEKDEKK